MTKREMRLWQQESIRQAYERLEDELLIQYCGFIPPYWRTHE